MGDRRWLVVLVAVLVGCTGASSPSPTAPDGSTTSTSTSIASGVETTSSTSSTTEPEGDTTTLRIGTTVPFSSLDPADAITLGDWELLHAVGDGLLRHEPGDGSLVPGIAEDLPDVSDDGLTYTFHLRPDVEFADGLDLTAPLYVDSIERVMRLGGRSSDLVSLYVSGVEAPDESTVVFQLRDRYAFFPTVLAGATYLPTHPDAYPEDQLMPLPEAPIYGVGPWYIDSYSETEMVLESNLRYHGEPTDPDRIVIQLYETTEEMGGALSSGEVDLIWRGIDGDIAESLSRVEDVKVESVPGGTMHFLTVNHTLAPTNDPAVRQALAELINREAIIETALGGEFEPIFSPIPPGYIGSSDAYLDVYGESDVEQAIEHLRSAGYSETNRAEIELAYPPERFGLDIAAAMEEVEQQIEATGLVEVTLTAQPWATYTGDVIEGTYNLAFLGWLHDFPDTHNYLAPFVLEGGVGGSGENVEYPELTDLVSEAASEFDEERRSEIYREIGTLYARDVVTIPLWIEHPYIAYRDYVGGSEVFDTPRSLNVGEGMLLDYRAVEITPPDDG